MHRPIVDTDTSGIVINNECLARREEKPEPHSNVSSGSKKARKWQSHGVSRSLSRPVHWHSCGGGGKALHLIELLLFSRELHYSNLGTMGGTQRFKIKHTIEQNYFLREWMKADLRKIQKVIIFRPLMFAEILYLANCRKYIN